MVKKYDFREVEQEILDFWQKNRTHQKANLKNKGKEKFYYLDGPPYTSGRVHIGTAWNKSLKDMILRYKRLCGFDVWDRAGYDMHGMPTEQGVEKELGIKHKDEIKKFGVQKFVEACKEFSLKNLKLMNEDFTRLGVWMDFDDPYMPITKEYIEGEWWLIKKAHENGRLYEGEKTMTWCAKCGTALARHELEYKEVSDNSIFLKFPVIGNKKEFLIIWTTTPWTIPFNLGVMVNPKLDYIRAKVDDEIWIVAKGLAGGLISSVADKKFRIIEEFKGDRLEGIRYVHPFEKDLKDEFDRLRKISPKIHTVVMSEEYVNLSAGSGLVHMAPGCGPEDYEVGHREGIPPYNELDYSGVFSARMGRFAGWVAKKDDKRFIDALDKTGLLIAVTKVEHDYAHCWRCKQPVVYRTTTQWFFRIEDMKENMRELNRDIYWVPDFAGSKNFDSWLANLRDNGITRQRYWGTPLPVWKCDKCKDYIVIGSVAELKKHAGTVPDDLHKPWIDEVTIKCKCGGVKKRIPDILDVWIDSGSASWNCLHFPQRKDIFERLYPADFILEGIDQIRGWFNLLFVASMVSMQRPSFKAVYMHGFVQDAQGRKMSKSMGNYILPQEIVDKYGADTLRYYMIGGANPGVEINYNFDDMKIKHKNLHIIWNLQNFILDMAKVNNLKPGKLEPERFSVEERYIISKMNSLIKKTTERVDGYYLNEIPGFPEELFLELSRTYIQMVRDKASTGSAEKKAMVFNVAYEVYMKALRLFSIVCPLITEKVYLNIKSAFGLKEESIFFLGWPGYDESLIDSKLESQFGTAQQVIQTILHIREKIQLGQRWPLRDAMIVSEKKDTLSAAKKLEPIIKRQTNIKKLVFADKSGKLSTGYEEGSFKDIKVFVNKELDKELEAEGFAREIMRRVQSLRKKAKLEKNDAIELCIVADKEMEAMLARWKDEISLRVGAAKCDICSDLECKIEGTSSVEKIKGREVTVCFNRAKKAA